MKQILFNTKMVRAIIDGRKSQTRRPIDWDISNNMDGDVASGYSVQTDDGLINALKLYRYQKGDILYVRETWRVHKNFDGISPKMVMVAMGGDTWGCIDYETNPREENFWGGWRPSIHMPKEAARLFLKVTGIRVERVQDITEENAIAEGCKMAGDFPAERKIDDGIYEGWDAAREWFADSWQNLYESKGYGWDDNPWVWTIEFERCEKPDDGQI